jgi:sugar/nucleoside kinase (ribokinase family)
MIAGGFRWRGTVTIGIFVGLSTVDIVYSVDAFPSANSKIVARNQDIFVGGPATNAAIAFSHLGGKSTLVTTVGSHPLASMITEELQRHSIGVIDLNPTFDRAPVLSSISVNVQGERNVVSANATRVIALPAQVNEATLASASIVLVDGHSMQACQSWASAARAHGVPVVFDGGSWKDGTDQLLKNIDIAICSADFLPPGCSGTEDVVNYLRDHGVKDIAITQGGEPLQFVSGDTRGTVQGPRVQLVDTMGAGDIFHGAFCYYATTKHRFVDALQKAANIASHSCRFRGTREWMNQPIRF